MINASLYTLALPLCAYLLGSIPFGLLIVHTLTKTDIRQIGSGNIGATNVKRIMGFKWAVITLICDGLKGYLPSYVATLLYSSTYQWLPAITALAAIVGHMYPIYLKLKPAGKGVATTFGCLIIIAPMAGAISIIVFILAVFWSRRSSVGSLTGAFIVPPATWFSTHDPVLSISTIVIMGLIFLRHTENLQRLAHGVEPTINH